MRKEERAEALQWIENQDDRVIDGDEKAAAAGAACGAIEKASTASDRKCDRIEKDARCGLSKATTHSDSERREQGEKEPSRLGLQECACV